MFTGEVPHGAGVTRVADSAPEYGYLDELIDRMRQQDPERRPSDIASIKKELLARQNEFVSLQKINSLQNEVVRQSTPTDPLIVNPIRLVDVDFTGSELIFTLSTAPSQEWIKNFQNPERSQFILGKEPRRFAFQGNRSRIPATGSDAQQLVDYFRGYVTNANEQFRRNAAHAAARAEAEQRERLRRDLEAEQARLRTLVKLKW